MTDLLASLAMTTHPVPTGPAHLPDARAASGVTYDRRRARAAAETLASITPARWDEATKRILLTLAAMLTPSAIDAALEAGALALNPIDVEAYERQMLRLQDTQEDALLIPPGEPRLFAWDDTDTVTLGCPAHGVHPHPHGWRCLDCAECASRTPCSAPCGQTDCEVACARMHDNGDYRA